MRFVLTVVFVLLVSIADARADFIWGLDFESGLGYSTSVPEFTDGAEDFFLRTQGGSPDVAGSFDVSGKQGDYFFAAQDLDGEGAVPPLMLMVDDVDISGFTGLEFSALWAEDDPGGWDLSDYVRVYAAIDGGGEQLIFAIENNGDTFNSAPFIDSDLDGTGDGAEVTSTFTRFTAPIFGVGNQLDLRFDFSLNSGDEDIALDDIQIAGTPTPVPEPTSLLLVGLAAVVGWRRSRGVDG